MNKKIAFCYDFDGTLSSGNMQEQDLLPDCNLTPLEFWSEVLETSKNIKADPVLIYMHLLLEKMKSSSIPITPETFNNYGKKLKLFAGVDTWFDRINAYGKIKNIEIEHYIISAGIAEMIYGCSFSKDIKEVYACSYYYRENGVVWPKLCVNFTAKTQFLYRIHKGTFEMSDQHSVNAKVEEGNINIPFNHMIFFGDGETDIPSFKIISAGGGCSVCVYDPSKEKSKKIADQLVLDQRVQYALKNDYSEGEELDKVVKNFIETI